LDGTVDSAFSQSSFKPIVSKVIAEASAVVPVVNGLELETGYWRELSGLVKQAGLQRPVDLVVCTHADGLSCVAQEHEMDCQRRKETIAKEFGISQDRIVVCAPKFGLASQVLLSKSSPTAKPNINPRDPRQELECIASGFRLTSFAALLTSLICRP
jgi:hypothetical protein